MKRKSQLIAAWNTEKRQKIMIMDQCEENKPVLASNGDVCDLMDQNDETKQTARTIPRVSFCCSIASNFIDISSSYYYYY